MKQMNELRCDIDDSVIRRRLMPLIVLAFCAFMFTNVSADTINNDENTKLVTAMYGFLNTKYADPSRYTDDDYVDDLVKSIYGKKSGPDFSKESVYVEYLVNSVNGMSQKSSPDFSNDDAYINHLVEVLLK